MSLTEIPKLIQSTLNETDIPAGKFKLEFLENTSFSFYCVPKIR